MEFAITLAKSTERQTSPNPAVGAVIVKDGEIAGFGAHIKAGDAHAEVNAIKMAGNRTEGATLYVTMEPCSHFGKTPPCADLIIEKKIKKVVIASFDPNPLVNGNGIEKLKQAGIVIITGVLQKKADEMNARYFHFIRKHLPLVTLKIACSLDGKTATKEYESKWITGEYARLDGYKLRSQHDAVLVGVNTINSDNPQLTTHSKNKAFNPIRVVLDTHLRINKNSLVLNDNLAPTWIITGNTIDANKENYIRQTQAKIIKMQTERVMIYDVLKYLGEQYVTSLLVEGGSTVQGSFLDDNFFDRVVFYIAPKLIGGIYSPSAIGGNGIKCLKDATKLNWSCVEKIGNDVKLVANVNEDS